MCLIFLGGEHKNLVIFKEGFQHNTLSSELCWVEIYLVLVTSILNYLLFSFYKGRREQNITQLSGYRTVLLSRVQVNIFYEAANLAQRYQRRDLCPQFYPPCFPEGSLQQALF